MAHDLTRRKCLAGAGVLSLLTAAPAWAKESVVELEWDDLIPGGGKGTMMETLRQLGIVQHGQLQTPFDQETAAAVVTDYDGKQVQLPGYPVPLEFEDTAIKAFILVPYIGACIHVPPPPPNQLVFVRVKEPFEIDSMWDPVYATGIFNSSAVATELAEIGYAMSDAFIEPYFW
ncbi:MAG: DUF3299 domain-containing protein [Pseudomonadota bacterium]